MTIASVPTRRLMQAMRRGSKAYDLMAAAPLIVWYSLGVAGQLQAIGVAIGQFDFRHPAGLSVLTILAKLGVILFAVLVIGFLAIRPPPKMGADGVLPRVAGILGTYLGVAILLLPPRSVGTIALAASTAMILAGIGFAAYALLSLGRSLSVMPEARTLVTSGPYALIRHPLYLGEQVAMIGVAIQYFSPAAVLLLVLQICCQLYRMSCEEKVLAQAFPEYEMYEARTARLVPGLY